MKLKLISLVQVYRSEINNLINDYVDRNQQDHVYVTQCSQGYLDVHFDKNDIPKFDGSDWETKSGNTKTVDQFNLTKDFDTSIIKLSFNHFNYEEI